MNIHNTLYELAHRFHLSPTAYAQLRELAQLNHAPPAVHRWLSHVLALLAGGLGGFGVILWVAANWDALGRVGRFAILQTLVAALCAAAILSPRARPAFALAAMCAIGGALAYFGQTYQTGADPWQLFALWSVLALPLCMAVRSDVMWAPWVVVAMTALGLWVSAETGSPWSTSQTMDQFIKLDAWLIGGLIVLAMSPFVQGITGAGRWSMRLALALLVNWVAVYAVYAVLGLLHTSVDALYYLGVLWLAGTVIVFARRRSFDAFCLSAAALAADVVIVAGIVRWMIDPNELDSAVRLFAIGIIAALILAATGSFIVQRVRAASPAQSATGSTAADSETDKAAS